MGSKVCMLNMRNTHVALLILSCSLWFSKVSAVKFEEFLGYPFGGVYGYSAFPSGVDQVRGVAIPTPFTFFGQIYNFANIDDSGYVSFINSTTAFPTPFTPRAFPFSGPSWSALVAAFWADISTTGSGTTYYKSFSATSSSDQPVLSGIDTYVRTTIPELNRFQASWALIVTWEAVGYYPAHTDLLNTFQIVVATNGAVSLAIFNYAEGGINWVTSDDNGGVNGFGGTPAIAGYNAGDGIRSFTIPQSMTDNIQFIDNTTGNTGNVGQWVFRIDSEQSLTFAKCQDSASLGLPLQLFPSVGHVFGGTPVLVSGLCVDPPHQDITCAFGSETKPGTYLSRQGQFLCIAPAMKKTGRVEFKMMVKDMNGISYVRVASFFYVSYNQGHRVQMSNCQSSVVKDSCIALGSGRGLNPKDSITLQWDKEILPYEGASSYTVDIILYEVNTATASLRVLKTLYSNVANSGAQTVTIPERKVKTQNGQIADEPAIAVVLNVAANIPTIPVQQAGVWTGIIFLAGRLQTLRQECIAWVSEDEDVVDTRVLPCPPMVNQARLPNSGLIEENYESIHGSTTYHQQFISTFHSGAESCFLQRERLISGVGTQCCYDTDGDLIVNRFNGGSIDKSAPVDYISSIMHIQDDLLPYIICCTARLCGRYYQNRRPVTDVGWNPPIPACIYGDPHIVTLDGHKYTFNGKGEFILIETDDGTFTLQGRMAEAINSFGQEAGATVFTSLVLKEVDSDTVQVDLTPDGLVALVNGEKVDFGNMTKLEFDQVNVEKGANQTITVTFGSGTFMEVTSANDIISTMVVSLPTVMQGLTRGLMGNYNGNITDDLQSKNESTTVSLNSSLEDIHYSFGITWIIDSANDSLFSYGANESWSDFYSPDFAPLFDLDLNSSQSLEAFDVCEGDLFCIFDIAATGNMAIGLTTLSGSQELEMINNLSAPVICDPPCGIGVCMPNNTCHCPTGYIGANCSVPVFEPCVDNICDNNATCTQHVETVTCECPDGYEGSLCEEPICNPPCVAGFCAQINICQCVSGYTGSTCSIAVPTLPLNVTVESVTNTSFRVTWQPPIFPLFGLIEYYEIEIYSNFLGLINTSANATVVTFNDLLPGTNYTVRVRAHTSVGGPFTEAELIQTLLEPSIPVNLTATSTGSTSIFVFWEPPLRFVGDILYYEITFRGIESPNQINSTFYQTSNLFSIATSVQINSYAIMPFSTYNVSVRAVNDVGPGPFSNEVLVRTIADAPSPPERLQPLSISARNITVTWDLPLNPNGIIGFYQIELMSEDGSITQQNSTQTVAAFTSLSPSAPYSIKVQAFTVEFGEFGPVLMVSTLAVSPEGLVYVMPQNVTADPGCSVVFTCMTTGGPGNTFQWSHNGLLLQGENNSMLMLSDVSAQSGGYYSCEVTNEAGNGSDFGIAFINPIFLEDPMPVTIIFDGSGNMTCTAKGFPAPMVTWMFGGAQAKQPVMESFLPGDALAIVSVLLFINVTYGSVGNYTCVASLPFITIEYNNTTSHTVTSISAYLLVQGVPESPFNVTVLETTSSSIFLTWLEPFGNNAPIIRYIVIFNDSSNGEVGTYTVEGNMEVANVTELKPFTEYAVRIFAANRVGQSSPSEQQLVTTAEDVPSPPLNVTVANKTSTAVLVTWLLPVAPNGVLTSYEIRYMGVSSLNPVPMSFYRDTTAVVSTLLTMHEVEDLVPSSYYAISVRAFTSVGAGQFSKMVIGGTEEDAPSPPRNVTVVNETSTTLLVTWLAPSIPNGVVINYEVNYTGFTSVNLVPTSFFQPQFITIPANETSVVLLDLVPYSKYTIVVRAYTSAGPGEYSEEIEDRTEEDVPASPLNVTIANSTSTIQLLVTWLPPSMPNGVLTNYEVNYTGVSSVNPVPDSFFQSHLITVSAENTSLELQHLVPYSNYTISVRAYTSVGPGNYSKGIEDRTEEDVPSVPLNVTLAIKSPTIMVVTWLPPFTPNGVITSYGVNYTGVSSVNPVPPFFYQPVSIEVSPPSTSLVLPGLVPHSNYTISVRAFTNAGPGEYSKAIEGRTDQHTPSVPLNVTVLNKTSTSLLITWLPPTAPNGVITSYEVYYRGVFSESLVPASFYQPLSITVYAPSTSLLLEGVFPYSNYTISVRAFTNAGPGEYSEVIEDRTEEDVPSVPMNVTVANKTSTSLLVIWLPPSVPNGILVKFGVQFMGISSENPVPLSFYQVQYINVPFPESSVLLQHLVPYSIYTISVRAYTSVGPGEYSNEIEDRTEQDFPSSPRNVTVVYKTPTSLLVTWDFPFIPNGVLTMYEVTYTGVSSVNPVPDSFFQPLYITVSSANTSLVLQHLVPYSNYTISVRAFTSVGPGNYSKGIEDRTEEDVPSSPLNVTVANKTSTTLLVTWLPPAIPNGVLTNFELCYTGVYSVNPVPSSFHQLQCKNIPFPAAYSLLEDLVPYSNYTISVRAVTSVGPGNSSTEIKGITKEDAPSSPLNVTVLSKTPTSLLVTWASPFIPNGVLTMYEVNYTGVSSGNPVPDSFFQPLYITASAPSTSLAVQQLVPYSNYTISVRAFTSAGPGEPSERIEDRTEEDAPSVPVNVTVANKTSTTLLVTWLPPAIPNGVLTSYEVYYRGLSSVNPVLPSFYQPLSVILSTVSTSIELVNLVPYSNYILSVRALTSGGPGEYSKQIEARTEEDAPSSPLNVTVLDQTPTSVLVTWVSPFTPNGVLTKYEVTYTGVSSVNPVPDSFFQSLYITASAPNTSLAVQQLVPYSNYTISVRAFTSGGPGEYSEQIEARTEEDAPSSPLNVTVLDQTPTSLLVTWASPFIPNGVLTKFEVTYTGVSSVNPVPDSFFQPLYITASAPNTSLAVQQLGPYSNYTISVRAFTSAGPGEPSERIEDRTEEDAPSVPVNVTVANKTSTTLLVTWLPPAIPNGVLTSYEVYYRGLSSVNPVLPSFYQPLSVTLSTVSTSIELVNLVPYSDYILSVRALTSGGPGEYNEQVEARTEEDAPSSPLNVTVLSKTPTSLLVTWVSPFIPNGVLSMYEVTYTGVSSVNPVPDSFFQSLYITASAPNTSLAVEQLVPYSNYTISVRAVTSAGPGEPSERIEDRTEEDAPSVPVNVTVANKTSTTLLVTWLPPAIPNGVLTSYEVYYRGLSSVNLVLPSFYQALSVILSTVSTSIELVNLVPYSDYTLSVRALTSGGPGEYNEQVEARTEEDAPSSPLNVTVLSKTPTSLLVTWASPFIPNGVLTMYEVTYTGVSSVNPVPDSFFQSLYITASAPNTSLAVEQLVPYSNYTISVRAVTSAGPGEPSERIEDRTEEDAPSVPVNVTVASKTSTTLLVTWLPPAIPNGVLTSYEVYYRGLSSVNPVLPSFYQALSVTLSTVSTSIELVNLVPYSNYILSVRALTSGGPGEYSKQIEARTEEDAPSSPLNVTVLDQTPTSVLVTWVSPFTPNGVLTKYEVTYTGVSSVNPVPDSFFQPLYITASAPNTSLAVQQLVPYSNYTISVRAFTSGGPGEYSEQIEARTEEDAPSSPLNVTVLDQTPTSLLVTWVSPFIPNGVLTKFEVTYTGVSSVNPVPDSFFQPLYITASAPNTSLAVEQLVPYSNYTISVRAFTSAGPGEPSERIEDRTEEDAPSVPVNVTVANKTSTTLLVTWLPPAIPNGVLTSYEVYYRGLSSVNPVLPSFYQPLSVTLSTVSTSIELVNLIPYSNYTLSVRALTSGGPGEYSEQVEARTEEDVPVLGHINATTNHYNIFMQWTLLFPNGIIRYYIVELRSNDGSVTRSLTTQNTSISIDSLPPAMTFTIQVCGFTIACGDSYTLTTATTGVQPEIFPQGGVKILKSSKDDSIVVAFVVAQAIPPATREQISWVFTSSSGQISIPCANNSEYTFSEDCLSLHIPRVAHKHGGKYQLFARTRAGMGSNAVTLVVTGVPPHVLSPLSNLTISFIEHLRLECAVVADPAPVLVWRFGAQRVVHDNDKYIISTNTSWSSLTVTKLGIPDGGMYMCSASNRYGTESTTAHVTIQVPPSLMLYPSSTRRVPSGGELIATCVATAEPPASIVWFKEGENLTDNVSTELTQGNMTTSRLMFESFTPADSSLYSCMASNFLGNDTATFFISTRENQSISSIELVSGSHSSSVFDAGAVTVEELDDLNVSCTARGSPPPKVAWLKDGILLQSQRSVRRKIQLTQTNQSETVTLHVTELLPTDAGMYTCIVLGGGVSSLPEETTWSFRLIVNAINACIASPCHNGGQCIDTVGDYICQCQKQGSVYNTGKRCEEVANAPSAPAIINNPKNQKNELNSPVSLTCEAVGSPMPVIQWFKDGVQLRGSGAVGNKYIIPELGAADRGSYHCEASNGFRDPVKSSEATVIVTGLVQVSVEVVQQGASTGKRKRQSEPTVDLVPRLELLAIDAQLVLDDDTSAVIVSVKKAADGPMVFTLSANSSQPPWVISGLVESPLRRLLQEYSDILPGYDFQVNEVQRHDGCPSVVDSSCSKGSTIVWPETEIGETVTVSCPCGSPRSSLLPALKAMRSCGGNYNNGAQWEDAFCGDCQFHDSRLMLCELSQTDSPSLLARLLAMTTQDASVFSSDDVLLTAALLDAIIVSVSDISMEQVQRDVLLIISNILGTEPEELLISQQNAMSSTRLLQVVQTVVESVESVPFVFSAPYFGLIVEDVGSQTQQIFMPNLATLVAAVANKTEMLPNVSSAQLVSSASASVSGSVLAHGNRVATTIFTHDSLFQQRPNFTSVREEQRKQVGSIIMQVAIVGSLITVTSNEDPAMYTFTKTETASESGERPACHTWNTTLDDEYGAWSNDNCVVTSVYGDELQCACTSLSYTTVRFDVGGGESPQIYYVRWVAVLGPSVAIICIGILLVLYLSNRNWRSSSHGMMLTNISLLLALFGLFLSYIFAAVSPSVPALCAIASASVHYFLLATFCWKLVEAVVMYRKTTASPKDMKYGQVISSLVCWLSPALIVALSIAPRYQNYINPLFCHSYNLSFWLGMVVPVIVICGATWTTYCLTMPNFICSLDKDGCTHCKSKRGQLWRKVFFTAIALSLLLSVVWITGCLVLLALPTSSQKAVDGIFTLLAIAYGVTTLTGHCLRPQMQSCTLCCHSQDESSSQNSCTISTTTTKSTLGRHHSEMEDFSTTSKPTEIGMQAITLINHQAAATNDALDSQSFHIAFGAADEAGRELHGGDDISSEDNAASLFNLKEHDECLVMENRMADDAL